MKKKIMMTSGFNFDGYVIDEYFGVYTGECALGTGFLSSLGAGLADVFGTNSSMYSEKLKKAKDYAVDQLIDQVINVGGNAIIGMDIDYTSFSSDIMGVVASGTAVRILNESYVESAEKIKVRKTNRNIDFRIISVDIKSVGEKEIFSIEIYSSKEFEVKGILTDISIRTIFNEIISCSNVRFFEFRKVANNHYEGIATTKEIPVDSINLIKDADIYVRKYVVSDEVVLVDQAVESDIDESSTQEYDWKYDFLLYIETLETAKEISQYMKDYNEKHDGIIDQMAVDEAVRLAGLERMYGNEKEDCVRAVRNYLE